VADGFAVEAAGDPGLVVLAADPADVVLVANTPTQHRARKSNGRGIPPLVFGTAAERGTRIGHHHSLLLACGMPLRRQLNSSLWRAAAEGFSISMGPVGFSAVDQIRPIF